MPRHSGRFRSLHPAAGRRLPAELRADRVGSVAERLALGARDRELRDLLERIDGGPLDTASRIDPFFDGDSALSEMLESIDSARREVLVEAYIFADDPTGERVAEALGRAVARGAAVRVLADAVGSFQTRRRFWRRLAQSGVEVRHFHPLLSGILWHQLRDHRKILVVDRRIAYTGGMNIADEYSRRRRAKGAPPESRKGMRDTHVRVEGPVAKSLAEVFAEGWEHSGVKPLVSSLLSDEALGDAPQVGPDIPVLVVDTRPGRGAEEVAATWVVGSANLDVRSWRINGECGLLAWDEKLAVSLEEAFRIDLESSVEISAESWARRGVPHKIGDFLAGLLTPLL